MPLLVECRCRQRFSAADHLAGTVVACPACGSPIHVAAPPPTSPPFAAGPRPNPHGTAWQQFTRNPFWYFLRGVDVAEYQPGQTPPATHRAQKLILASLALVVLGLALLTFVIATVRFGPWLGLLMTLMGLGVAFVPLLFGFYFVAAGLLESNLLMMSRRGRGVRYLFGDRGARWFFIVCGCPALLIGFLIQLAFVAGAAIGKDPDRHRNPPAQFMAQPAAELPPKPVVLDRRTREQEAEKFKRENPDLYRDHPEVAASLEYTIREGKLPPEPPDRPDP
jgi:hypothetical protein